MLLARPLNDVATVRSRGDGGVAVPSVTIVLTCGSA